MTFYPANLSLTGRKCLVVGTTPQAITTANELFAQSAIVTVIGSSEPVTGSLSAGITHRQDDFSLTDIDGCWLVVAASASQSVNQNIGKHCDEQQVFCYNPDQSAGSTWKPVTGAIITADSTDEGMVSLVGAGPGHPDLLTVRALKLIQSADAIVYDRLVSEPILALCNSNAKFIYAGKAKANHTLAQQSINALLVELAQEHKNVVRLKGGDPFIFGRGGEEIETLADHNVRFQVVPGITAASGCAAFSGIPLTHRDHAQSCIFVTGHLRNGDINLNWQELTDPHQTIVVYMGLTGIELICNSLIEHGRTADTPAALIERGTNPEQRVLCSTLKNLPDLVAASDVVAPTMLIIGGVVSLRDKLKWF